MNNSDQIRIKIQDSLSANAFNEGSRLHQREYDKVTSLIDGQLNIAEKYPNKLEEFSKLGEVIYRSHNTISIFGDRGVGKTSFLLSLREQYKNSDNIFLLPIVDPTLIEEKGHIFLLLITIIDDIVQRYINENIKNYEKEEINRIYSQWTDKKNELARGIPSLDRVGLTYEEPQWQEDEYVMTRGMQSVSAAFKLELHFHELIDIALKIIKKKAFLLLFDDIDVDFRKGWSVLECIRKYLTTPQIIILLSGNMKLYSKNVRSQQWKNLGKALLKNEVDLAKDRLEDYTQMVDQLESQYLLKVLKSENRIYLHSIYENNLMYGIKYMVIDEESAEEKEIQLYYRDIFNMYGIHGVTAVNKFVNFMMNASARTQLHFIYNAKLAMGDSILSTINPFISRIYAQGVNIDLSVNYRYFNIILLKYLIEKNQVEEGYQLLPNFYDSDRNSVMAGFSFIFTQLVKKNPSLIFEYWSKVTYLRNVVMLLDYDKDSIKSVYRYLSSSGSDQITEQQFVIGNALAFLYSTIKGFKAVDSVSLMAFGQTSKKNVSNRIDNVLKDQGLNQILGYLPLISLASDKSNNTSLYYSFYGLLAVIGDLLTVDGEDEVYAALQNAVQVRNYLTANEELNSETSFNDLPENECIFSVGAMEKLVKDFAAWKKKFNDSHILYGAHMFGKIATRLHHNLGKIVLNNRNVSLGKQFNLMTAALFNTCIIEELRESATLGFKGINTNAIVTSTDLFFSNLLYIKNSNLLDKIPFTLWLVSCPILIAFFKDSSDLFGIVGTLKDENIMPYMSGYERLIYLLDKVAIKTTGLQIFTLAKGKINLTLDAINNSPIDIEIVMNGKTQEAIEELSRVFKKVTSNNVTLLRKECYLYEGKVILRNTIKSNLE